MEVKIFESDNGRLIEIKIKSWLKENPLIKVIQILQTEVEAGITITIFYTR